MLGKSAYICMSVNIGTAALLDLPFALLGQGNQSLRTYPVVVLWNCHRTCKHAFEHVPTCLMAAVAPNMNGIAELI